MSYCIILEKNVAVWEAEDAWAIFCGLAGQSIRLEWSLGYFSDVYR